MEKIVLSHLTSKKGRYVDIMSTNSVNYQEDEDVHEMMSWIGDN